MHTCSQWDVRQLVCNGCQQALDLVVLGVAAREKIQVCWLNEEIIRIKKGVGYDHEQQ
jgi:hypothetical protein